MLRACLPLAADPLLHRTENFPGESPRALRPTRIHSLSGHIRACVFTFPSCGSDRNTRCIW